MIEIAVMGSEFPSSTVNVEVAVATDLSGLVAMAVIVAVPLPTPVASPPEVMVATAVLLEFHLT